MPSTLVKSNPEHLPKAPKIPLSPKHGFLFQQLFAWTVGFAFSCGASAQIASIQPAARDFIERTCYECHDDVYKEGDFDLTSFPFEPGNRENLEQWIRVHDRVEAGEMPPKKKRNQPDPEETAAFVEAMASTLTEVDRARIERDGRAVQRRLNRYEYENALRDLLNIPWAPIKSQLPPDGEAHRYNKIGEALDVSHIQMARYMSSADYALRQAMSVEFERDRPATTTRYYARDEPSLTRAFRQREGSTLTDRLAIPVLDSKAQPDVRAGRAPLSSPETRDREAVAKVTSTFSDAGGYRWGQFRAPVGGRYKLRFSGYSVWVSGGGVSRWFFEGTGEEKAPVYWVPLWHRPNLDEVWRGRRDEPIGVYAQTPGQQRVLGEFDFSPDPSVHELDVVLLPNEVIQTDGSRLFRTRVNGTNEQYVNPLAEPDGIPGYAVQWMEVEGPLRDDNTQAGYRLLFGDLPLHRVADDAPGVKLSIVAEEKPAESGFRFHVPMEEIKVEVVTDNPVEDAEVLLRQFMNRAYRRPVEERDVDLFLKFFNDQFAQGFGFTQSMVSTYTAVLASPGFVFLAEQPGKLDGYALATRLSLFLWNSEPDDELRRVARSGELTRPEVLRKQTERLLNDPKSRRFVDAFTDYWLDLRELDDTSPSSTLYNDYELDDPLKQASLEETRLFVNEMFRENLPARNIVDSDFTFLNERLALHYGIPGVKGASMRKVTLPSDSVRGGLMTQASVLKVTANGTTTSPVLRGYWITERILGYQIPPPPPVAAVEPDIRGAVTIRQQLEKHRDDPSCASCHTRMDPPGFALESFDVMGGWRDRYRAASEDVEPAPGVGMNGQAFAFHYALAVDSSGELPDGRAFNNVRNFKKLLIEDEETIARNFASQLAVYATGAPVSFSDREKIDTILRETEVDDYGSRSIVHAIVQSDLFRMK